jgi:hypothetical protein
MKKKTPPPAPPLALAPPAEDNILPFTPPAAAVPQSGASPARHDFQSAAELVRSTVWDLSAEPAFGDLPLHPWSHERHTLAARLIAADVPSRPLAELVRMQALIAKTDGLSTSELGAYVDLTAYLPDAEKILFLAAHEPHEFNHLRGTQITRFFSAIAAWSAENIAPADYALACLTAHQISTQHESVLAMHQPRRGGQGITKN